MRIETPAKRASLVRLSTLVSLCGLVANTRLGTPAIVVFFGVWLLMLAAWPTFVTQAFHVRLLPWLLPVLAIVSVAWSSEPTVSLRLAVELTLCTALVSSSRRCSRHAGSSLP